MAEEVGLTPVAYQKLSPKFDEIKKYENLEYADVLRSLPNIIQTKMKDCSEGSMYLTKMSDLKIRTDIAKEMGLVANDIPENSLHVSIVDDKDVVRHTQLLIFAKMTQGLKDIFNGKPQYQQPFTC